MLNPPTLPYILKHTDTWTYTHQKKSKPLNLKKESEVFKVIYKCDNSTFRYFIWFQEFLMANNTTDSKF